VAGATPEKKVVAKPTPVATAVPVQTEKWTIPFAEHTSNFLLAEVQQNWPKLLASVLLELNEVAIPMEFHNFCMRGERKSPFVSFHLPTLESGVGLPLLTEGVEAGHFHFYLDVLQAVSDMATNRLAAIEKSRRKAKALAELTPQQRVDLGFEEES